MTLKFKTEAEFAAWNAARHKAIEARQAECGCVPCQRSRAERDQAEIKARGISYADLEAERATAAAQATADCRAADMESAYNAGALIPEERDLMRAAIATRNATTEITEGLRGVLAIADGDGRGMIEALPYYDRIETGAAAAQYAIESTLHWRKRRRHAWDFMLIVLMVVAAAVIAWGVGP